MRGKRAPKRRIKPDSKYNSVNIAKFINYLMRRGKRSIAEKVVYGCFDLLEKKGHKDAMDVFDRAIKNISPSVEVRGRRIGGGNYQIPVPVKGDRKLALAYRWLIAAAQNRKGRSMAEKLAEELLAACEEQGDAMKKKQDVFKMAEANRAFAHFARF